MSKLLVVDDEQTICWGLGRVGQDLGHQVTVAASAEQALDAVRRERPDVIVLDVRLPGMSGLDAMERLREQAGPVPIIVITAYGDLQTAVEAVRNGAFDYIVKPFDTQRVRQALWRALGHTGASVPRALTLPAVGGFVGSTPVMQEVFNRIALAAASHAGVLLQGESGTGKELAARAIHKFSNRGNAPFVAVSVAALNPTVAESELFGHVRGAFTGADQSRVGLLKQAAGGTLFLDEVADIPLPTQVKLLRALETGEVFPVGSSEPLRSDFRLISATHQDLLHNVRQGTFRHDLYFRLSAFRIELPPLRERRGDIVPLAENFLSLLAERGADGRLSADAQHELEGRPWYGNVRELRNAMEHALIVARGGTILPEHLPTPAPATLAEQSPDQSVEAAITALIEQWTARQLKQSPSSTDLYEQVQQLIEPPLFKTLLEHCDGQHAASARLLGLHRTTLRKKLEQHDLLREPDDAETD